MQVFKRNEACRSLLLFFSLISKLISITELLSQWRRRVLRSLQFQLMIATIVARQNNVNCVYHSFRLIWRIAHYTRRYTSILTTPRFKLSVRVHCNYGEANRARIFSINLMKRPWRPKSLSRCDCVFNCDATLCKQKEEKKKKIFDHPLSSGCFVEISRMFAHVRLCDQINKRGYLLVNSSQLQF